MTNIHKGVILITGASSGIGKATALLLSQKGYTVYGTGRNPDGATHPDHPGIKMLRMDVCDETSIDDAVNTIVKSEGRLDIVVNNAGFGIAGAVEDTSDEEAKSQFNTNFFGMMSVCRRVLPVMREQKSGRIINVGSVAGLISIPFQSMYSASKYAVEAFSEALRVEARPFGIKVSIVEPGDTKTGFTKSRQVTENAGKDDSAYRKRFLRSVSVMEKDEMNGPEPVKVARGIYALIRSGRPPVRKVIGFEYKLLTVLKRIMPACIIDFVIEKMYG